MAAVVMGNNISLYIPDLDEESRHNLKIGVLELITTEPVRINRISIARYANILFLRDILLFVVLWLLLLELN